MGVHLGHGENEEVRMVHTFLGFIGHVQEYSLSLEQWEVIEGDLVHLGFVNITQPALTEAVCAL